MEQREIETMQQIKQQQREAERRRRGEPPEITTYLLNFKTRRDSRCGVLV